MGIDEKIAEIENLDDWYKKFKDEEKHKKVGDAFKAIESFEEDDHINHLYNNVFGDAFQEFYTTLKTELHNALGGDSAKTKGKEKEIKTAIVEALKKFFEKAMPSVLKAVEGTDDVEEAYTILTHQYGELVGHDANPLDNIAQLYSSNKKKTVGHLRKELRSGEDTYKNQIIAQLINKGAAHHLGQFNQGEVAHYVRGRAEKKGFEFDDKPTFYTLDVLGLYSAHKGIKKGSWGIDPKTGKAKEAKNYGLKPNSE